MVDNLFEMLIDLPASWDLGIRITFLLSLSWVVHLLLVKSNPRWRVQLWRFTSVAVIAVSISVFMPKFSMSVTPVENGSAGMGSSLFGLNEEEQYDIEMNEPKLVGSISSSDKNHDYFIPALKPEPAFAFVPVEEPEQSFLSLIKEHLGLILFTCWGIGAFLFSTRWIAAQIRIHKLLLKSKQVSEKQLPVFARIAKQIGVKHQYKLSVSSEIDVPFVAGLIHPVVVLPEKMLEKNYSNELPAIFAHELTHIKSHDLLWMGLAQWVSIPLWFHPLTWKIRAVHSMACEEVADTVAADFVGDVTSYSSTLARVALDANSQPPVVAAMSMARTPQVMLRLKRLKQGLSNLPLTRRSLLLTAFAGLLALAPLASLEFAYAKINKARIAGDGNFEPGRVLNFPEKQSVGRIEIALEEESDFFDTYYRAYDLQRMYRWEYFTEAKGKVTIPKGAKVKLTLRKAGARNMSWVKKLKSDDLHELFIYPHPQNQNSYKFGNQQAKHLKHLSGLVNLEFMYVNVKGKGFQFLESMQSLVNMRIYSPEMGNESLKHVGKLSSLKFLSLGKAKYDDKGVAHLVNLKSLEHIHLSNTGKPGPGYESVVTLSKLKYLSTYGFNDSHLKLLKNATQLTALNLYGNENITDASLAFISQLKNLEYLQLGRTNITDDGLVHLKDMKSLKQLELMVNIRTRNPRITAKGAKLISELSSLEVIHFRHLGNVNECFGHFSKLKNLKSLFLGHSEKNDPVTELGIHSLTELSKLERLILGGSGTYIDGDALDLLAEITSLVDLQFSVSKDLLNKDLARLKPLVNLEALKISAYQKRDQLTPPALNHLNGMPNLKRITVHMKPAKPHEEALNLSGLPQLLSYMGGGLRDEDLAGFANCKNMRDFQIGHKSTFTDKGLASIAHLKLVERISLSGIGITDKGLANLDNMKQLSMLYIKADLTNEGLKKIGEMKSLQSINVTSSNKLDQKSIKRLYKDLPNVNMFSVKQGMVPGRLQAIQKKIRLRVGQVAPQFQFTSLKGENISLTDYQGKVTLLYFWSTSCRPCIASMPKLKEAHKGLSEYKDFAMISLSGDDDKLKLQKYLKEQKLPWPQIQIGADSFIEGKYGVKGYPSYFLIGRNGKLLHAGAGKGLDTALRKALDTEDEK